MANGKRAQNDGCYIATNPRRGKAVGKSRTSFNGSWDSRIERYARVSSRSVDRDLVSRPVCAMYAVTFRSRRPCGQCVQRTTARFLAERYGSLPRDTLRGATGWPPALERTTVTRSLDGSSRRDEARQRLLSK